MILSFFSQAQLKKDTLKIKLDEQLTNDHKVKYGSFNLISVKQNNFINNILLWLCASKKAQQVKPNYYISIYDS